MEFEEACSEMDYILEHLNPEDLAKIPMAVRDIFKNNKSIFYKVSLDETKPLYEQKLKEETKAFIQIINAKYLTSAESIESLEELLKLDIIEENTNKISEIVNIDNDSSKELIIYKGNKIITFIKKLLNRLKK